MTKMKPEKKLPPVPATLKEFGELLKERELWSKVFVYPEGFCVWLYAPDDPELGVFPGSHADLAVAAHAALCAWDTAEVEEELIDVPGNPEDEKPN